LYGADVAGSISGVLSTVAVGAVLAIAAAGVTYASIGDGPTIWEWDNKEEKRAHHKAMMATLKKVPKIAAIVFLSSSLTASIIPSKETVYAIAASEMGENVLNTQTGDKAVKALNAWLDRQITQEGH
jgi:hypothetical protein